MLNEAALKAQLDELRKSFADGQKDLARARAELDALTVRTESKDGRISISLDSTGAITDLSFSDDSYRDLKPKELSKKLLDVITEARADLQAKVSKTMPKPPQQAFSIDKLLDPKTDLLDILPPDLPGASMSQGSAALDPFRGGKHG